MKIRKKIIPAFLTTLLLLSTTLIFAQDDGPEPPPPASVNRYVVLLTIAGIVFAWHMLKKKARFNAASK